MWVFLQQQPKSGVPDLHGGQSSPCDAAGFLALLQQEPEVLKNAATVEFMEQQIATWLSLGNPLPNLVPVWSEVVGLADRAIAFGFL